MVMCDWWRTSTRPIDRRTSMAPHHPRQAGVLPGARWWAVAVEHLGAVGVPGGSGAVGVQDQGPAPPVDHDLVVEETQQDAACDTGGAAVRLVPDVVDLAGPGGGRLAAADRQGRSGGVRGWGGAAGAVAEWPVSSGKLGVRLAGAQEAGQ